MTRRERSESQLNAEAQGPRRRPTADPDDTYVVMGLRPRFLDCGQAVHGERRAADRYGSLHWQWCCYIAEARHEWRMALPEELHVHRVPDRMERIKLGTKPDGRVVSMLARDVGPLGGMPFHPDFVTHIDAPREAIIRAARQYRERVCARRHGDWPDHRGRAVCGDLLLNVIGVGQPIEVIADRLDMTPERASRHLESALHRIWDWRSRDLNEVDGRRVRDESKSA